MNKHNTASMQNGKKRPSFSILPEKPDGAEDWFYTFMCMNIPIAGWFYLFRLAFNKKNTQRQNFARAYLFYKLIFLAISAVILGILIYVGLDLLDQVLAYMEML